MDGEWRGRSPALDIAVMTVSDTRDQARDTSGQFLAEAVVAAGHRVSDKTIVRDNVYQIRAVLSAWIAADDIDAVLVTGGYRVFRQGQHTRSGDAVV